MWSWISARSRSVYSRLCMYTLSISQSVSCLSHSCLNMIATTHSLFTDMGIFDLVGRVDVAKTRT